MPAVPGTRRRYRNGTLPGTLLPVPQVPLRLYGNQALVVEKCLYDWSLRAHFHVVIVKQFRAFVLFERLKYLEYTKHYD